jgi:hypothetical protein
MAYGPWLLQLTTMKNEHTGSHGATKQFHDAEIISSTGTGPVLIPSVGQDGAQGACLQERQLRTETQTAACSAYSADHT